MDTIKDRQRLENLHESGQAPWQRAPLEAVGEIAVPADVRVQPVGS